MEKPPVETHKPEVIFYDDFGGRALDRSRWNVATPGHIVNDEQQVYVDSSDTVYISSGEEVTGAVNGSALVLHPHYRPNVFTQDDLSLDFVSGRIDTREKFEFLYGTAEARMRLPQGRGFWPAFWAMGNMPWPDAGEIDIMENIGETDWTSSAAHGPGYSGEEGLVNYFYLPLEHDTTNWHVYGVTWSPGLLLFKVDGVLMFRVTAAMVKFFGSWVFDSAKYLILNLALGGTYPFKLNGVRSPYYGLPEETVEKIKTGQAKMLVDWVRVTKFSGPER